MSLIKKTLLAIGIIFIAIQFIQPASNKSSLVLVTDISKIVSISDSVQNILKNACYDCHSNNTNYPWYSNIQPMSWIMANHITQGKEELNFSEFGTYSKRKQANKLRSMGMSIQDGSMPLSSYMIMHTDAKLSIEDKKLITDWATNIKDSLTRN